MTIYYSLYNRFVLTWNMICIKKFLFIILLLFINWAAYAKDSGGEYNLEAEHVEYNSKENIIVAEGKVELFGKDQLLKANKVLYDKKNDKITAYGKVVLLKPNGEEVYADALELDNPLKEMVASKLKARFRDNNVFTAKNAHSYPDRIIFDKATYSPCEICKDNKPQWQVRSSEIEYVKKKNTSFTNNFFDVYGITSFYLPYLRVASHDAEPKSGFLFPSYQTYRDIYGYGISIPYYLRINDSNDFLYAPIVTTKRQILHSGKYRFMIQEGNTNTFGFDYVNSKQNTTPSPSRHRFYVKTDFKHNFAPNMLVDSKIEAVSDKSYLGNYHGETPNYLHSFVNFNYLPGSDSQFNGATHHFQDLRVSDSVYNTDIAVAPRLEYDRTIFNGDDRYYIQSEALNVVKRKGGNTAKANLKLNWDNNYAFNNHRIETSKIVYLDLYKFQNVKSKPTSTYRKSYTFARITPEAFVAWKYPVMLSNKMTLTYVEPTVKLIVSPLAVHNSNVFNEDSQEIELNDSNLFSTNRYPGADRLEEGTRVSYGFIGAGQIVSEQYPRYNFVFGQSYRFKKGGDYSVNSGLKDSKISDYVGRISFKTLPIMDVHYMFQIDKNAHIFRRNEISSVFTFDLANETFNKLVASVNLGAYDYKQNLSGIKQTAALSGTLHFLKEWYASASIVENRSKTLTKPIDMNFGLGYKGQCTNIVLSVKCNNTKDLKRGIKKGGIAYTFDINLKNIN